MNKEKALNLLRAYRDELTAIRSRLVKADSSSAFSDDDNKRYHHIGLTLKDFTADHLMDNRRTSFQLVRQFTQSMSMSNGQPTARGMGGYLEAVEDLISRLEMSRLILRQRPVGERQSATPAANDSAPATQAKTVEAAPLEQIAKRFHLVERQLREHATPTSSEVEYEQRVQNLFHALLILYFDHVEQEQWTPAYADDGVAVSFYIPGIRTVVEIRKPAKDLEVDTLKEQLSHHIEKYRAHPECDAVFCYLYDPIGRIPDPRGLEKAMGQSENGPKVSVNIIPPEGH